MKRIDQYEGLYRQSTQENLQGSLYSELLEARSQSFDWVIQPHIHPDLFQIFFIQTGEFEFHEANSRRTMRAPCLILIPAAVLHGFVFNANCKGRILSISGAMVNTLFPGKDILSPMFQTAFLNEAFSPSYSAEKILSLIRAVDEELFATETEKDLMLKSCLEQLFLAIYRLWLNNRTMKPVGDNTTLKYFRKFQQALRACEGKPGVNDLAAQIGVSTVHLNRICNQVTGKSAGELIQEYTLEEAKKYLTYTAYNVSEIAYLLNFEYPNYFARFFKKHTGLTPLQYRKEKR